MNVNAARAGITAMLLLTVTTATADPMLVSLVRTAWQTNPDLQAATYRTAAAQAALRQARSAYYPRLYAAAGYTLTDNPPQAFMMSLNQRRLDMRDLSFDPNAADDTDNLRFTVGARYRLYDGARGPRTAAAGFTGRIAAEQLRSARNVLAHMVTRGYYQVLEAQDFAAVQSAALESLEESLRAARERFDSGSAIKPDVLNLEVQVAQASENLIRARNGIQLAIAALNTSVGEAIVPDTGLPEPDMDVPEPGVSVSADFIPERAEAMVASLQAEAADRMFAAARRGRGPVVDAFGSLDWDSQDLDRQDRSYMVGVLLEWEFFSGFEAAGKVAEARARLAEAEAVQAHVRQALELDMKHARLMLQEARARLDVTARAVDGAGESLRITRARYREGATDIAALLVAELGLTETRMRETAARYDYRIAQSNLARAVGWLEDWFQDGQWNTGEIR